MKAESPCLRPPALPQHPSRQIGIVTVVGTMLALVVLIIVLQHTLDLRVDQSTVTIQELSQLPRGEYLKPVLLGYHHMGADLLWLQMLQVLGKRQNSADEYTWLYHALDVITTLDPQYVYAYYVGGVILTDLAERVDLSNRLLTRGHSVNPYEWSLSFLLGYNHYFVLGDARAGAEYIGRAAQVPGAPDFLPGLATRMYAESGNPTVALQFLEELWKNNPDVAAREKLDSRAREVVIERDIRLLESAVQLYRNRHGHLPGLLQDVVKDGVLAQIPSEPFGGSYELDSKTGSVSSSTHPNRLKVFRRNKHDRV